MLIHSLKIRSILLLLLFLPLVCNAKDDAENSGMPAKFYDGLQDKVQKITKYYTVKQNERLEAIAARYGYNYLKLAQWNDIPAPYRVVVGQQLKLFDDKKTKTPSPTFTDTADDAELLTQKSKLATAPVNRKKASLKKSFSNPAPSLNTNNIARTESYYLVGKNESLYSISLRFKVSIKQLVAWNGMTSPNQLYAGQKLKIFKEKQKHSSLISSKLPPKITKFVRGNPQKTSIISNNNKSMLKFHCQWPTEGKIIKNFSQTDDRGVEISGKTGQVIKATAAGKVVAVSPGIYGHGSFIVLQHKDQYLSSYTNNRRSLVKNGQRVAQGQIIAEMGRVGRKPPSLEFEIRKNGKLVDPMQFLPKKI